jgi:hypothetical protein
VTPRLVPALVLLLLAPVARAQVVQTATITVDSPADVDARDGVMTLREAILLATGQLATGSLTADERDNVSGSPGAASSDRIVFDTEVFPAEAPTPIELEANLPSLGTGRDGIDAVGSGVRLVCTKDSLTALSIASDENTVSGLELLGCDQALLVDGEDNVIGGAGPAQGTS